eukprot:SAG11_NODE_1480_length_4835_cov_3.840794_2_plen_129_part_00
MTRSSEQDSSGLATPKRKEGGGAGEPDGPPRARKNRTTKKQATPRCGFLCSRFSFILGGGVTKFQRLLRGSGKPDRAGGRLERDRRLLPPYSESLPVIDLVSSQILELFQIQNGSLRLASIVLSPSRL